MLLLFCLKGDSIFYFLKNIKHCLRSGDDEGKGFILLYFYCVWWKKQEFLMVQSFCVFVIYIEAFWGPALPGHIFLYIS